jgi:hypothetical protein
MATPCDQIEPFFDGALSQEEAEAFRLHLADCTKCQQEMDNLLQLHLLGQRSVERAARHEAAKAPRPTPRFRWKLPSLGAAAALAATLLVGVWVRLPTALSLQSDVWLAQNSKRLLEARVSHPNADGYRPLMDKMMGGGAAEEELSHEDLALLEKHDPHGMVAALLVRDDPDFAGQALKKVLKLKESGGSPDLDSDHAVALLLKGKKEEALRLLDAALEQSPRHPQALWNRGLVLRELGLPLLAARDFSEVAALKEEGWSKEAETKAEALRSAEFERRGRWEAVSNAGKALLAEGPEATGALPRDFSQFPSARRHFYEAIRVAPSRDRVLALLPIAQELDAQAGGSVLESFVRRVAEADFSRRAPLARSYAQLLQASLSYEEKERLLTALLASKEDDILLGALVAMEATSRNLEVFESKAAASGDPWFQLLAAEERSVAEAGKGNWTRAIQALHDARERCTGRGLEYLCMLLDSSLSGSYLTLHQLEPARTRAELGWKAARTRGEWLLESSLLWTLAETARLSGDGSLARAYLLEYLERDRDNPETVRRVHQILAVMEMKDLQVQEARREIDAALATGRPLGLPGVFALADISRLKSDPGDEARLTREVEALMPRLSPGEQLIATHVLGRFFIERDEARARQLLWRVIEEAEAPALAKASAARRARAYSFTSLLFAAGRQKDFQEALRLFERERQWELPRRCLLAAAADSERTLFLVLNEEGALTGHFDEKRRHPLPQRLEGVVPEALLTQFDKCERVEVLARPPLHGRAGLLPPKLAWSYLTRTSAPRVPSADAAVHLVVQDVEIPSGVPLKRLNDWAASFGAEEQPVKLSGAQATPSRVLAAMKDATEIDLVAHGILNDFSDASYLVLAPEPGGSELSISKVRTASLQGAPFVVLAACHAAHATWSVDDPLSLPAAFIEAGARGVLAATVEIPDLEAAAFFNAIRERMRSGTAPALALHEERMRWIREGRGATWLDSVLLFE